MAYKQEAGLQSRVSSYLRQGPAAARSVSCKHSIKHSPILTLSRKNPYYLFVENGYQGYQHQRSKSQVLAHHAPDGKRAGADPQSRSRAARRICRDMRRKNLVTGDGNEPRRKRYDHSSINKLEPCHPMPDHRHVHIGGSISGDELASYPLRACPSWPCRVKTQEE
ncbi:hypothetical protein G5I_08639 [Acromyrmex echinatior]|uniref:Uncharacterized protein n=1 Tax=Acromyrmex echinatior TaxID=103372 RepID=F4WS29_ACREC|nr:hypothetical protein G5I_08639 [Acromyrmex echinatior]